MFKDLKRRVLNKEPCGSLREEGVSQIINDGS